MQTFRITNLIINMPKRIKGRITFQSWVYRRKPLPTLVQYYQKTQNTIPNT